MLWLLMMMVLGIGYANWEHIDWARTGLNVVNSERWPNNVLFSLKNIYFQPKTLNGKKRRHLPDPKALATSHVRLQDIFARVKS